MSVESKIQQQRAFFRNGQTKTYDFRRNSLKKLLQLVEDNESKIIAALKADLYKPEFESVLGEIEFVIQEIHHTLKGLKKWMKPQKVKTPLLHFPAKSYILHEPYGCNLIISPWNYPFQLAIAPLVGAIAAGNCSIIKPSELAPNTSALLKKLINDTFDPGFVHVIEGAVEETTELLSHKFDYIFFTGSTQVGKIVMKAAAEHLTPVTLELGGKSPCIVDKNVPMDITAKRIAWGKFFNAGQTCIAPDYVYVHSSVKQEFFAAMRNVLDAFYEKDPLQSDSYARIINHRHFERLSHLINPAQIAYGGKSQKDQKYIEPTILKDVVWTDLVMQEEIFGPLLPVLEWDTPDQLIKQLQDQPKPLAFYVFSKNQRFIDELLSQTSSGGVCINETISHITTAYLPFGGVGDSGMGNYHSRFSFETFSHQKSVMHKSFKPDAPQKYAPYLKISPAIRRILKIIN